METESFSVFKVLRIFSDRPVAVAEWTACPLTMREVS